MDNKAVVCSCKHRCPVVHPKNGGTRAVKPCNFACSSVSAETSGFNGTISTGTIFTGITPIRRAW
ncbi:MAG: hypothetical protein GWN58_11385 [Anaerolineae bacterium]|nr:hypothetical protein [Anaerolineae bacterium]